MKSKNVSGKDSQPEMLWDGTDIEPGHPRNTVKSKEYKDDESYFRRYSEGDRFS
ncbi:MAG: hypothetical protein ACO24H_02330 [Polynucleobacter sp.]